MKTIGRFEFPETPEEAKEWRPTVTHHALAMRVLCVATTRIEGMWTAYSKDVPGYNHSKEKEEVLAYGDKLCETVALALFPVFEGIPYAR